MDLSRLVKAIEKIKDFDAENQYFEEVDLDELMEEISSLADGWAEIEKNLKRESNLPHKYDVGEQIRWIDDMDTIEFIYRIADKINADGAEMWDRFENAICEIISIYYNVVDGLLMPIYHTVDEDGNEIEIPEAYAEFAY